MNRKVNAILAAGLVALSLSACAQSKVINGVEYRGYGLVNKEDRKNPNIEYKIVWGNVIWAAILVESVVAPVYFIGWSIMEPVGPKDVNQAPH